MAIPVQTSATSAYFEQPPIQVNIRQVPSDPDGNMESPPGRMVVDVVGNLYVKKSEAGLMTGWKKVTTAA